MALGIMAWGPGWLSLDDGIRKVQGYQGAFTEGQVEGWDSAKHTGDRKSQSALSKDMNESKTVEKISECGGDMIPFFAHRRAGQTTPMLVRRSRSVPQQDGPACGLPQPAFHRFDVGSPAK